VDKEHLNVGRNESWFADFDAFTSEEKHGHDDQYGVMVPAAPTAHLILTEAPLLLGVL